MDFDLEERLKRTEANIEERFDFLEEELANFMETLRIVAGENQKSAVKIKSLLAESERLSNLTAAHEKRISELEEGFLFEN
jgi:chromosome segregation ATPase